MLQTIMSVNDPRYPFRKLPKLSQESEAVSIEHLSKIRYIIVLVSPCLRRELLKSVWRAISKRVARVRLGDETDYRINT